MNRLDIEEMIASANHLISEVRRDAELLLLPVRRRNHRSSVLTVSPEAQVQINNIDHLIQAIPNGNRTNSAEGEVEVTNNGTVTLQASTEDSEVTNNEIAANANATPARRRHANVVEIIDLCSDSPEPARPVRNIRTSGLNDVVSLDSPENSVSSMVRRRNRLRLAAEGSENHVPVVKRNRSINNDNNNKKDNNENLTMICAICMDSYISRQPTTTKCGHVFCYRCITQSLKVGKKCPICRTTITERTLVRIHL